MTQLSDIPDNAAVQWGGTRFGLFPTLSEDAERIMDEGPAAVPILMDAVTLPHIFITAHVLLTKITGVRHETFPSWNGLDVNIHATGDVEIDAEQRHRLAKRWRLYFQTEPRPASLP
jgi:hypothetical protein